MVQIYLFCGSVVTLGFVWFWIVRPIAVSARDAYVDWRTPPAPRRRRPGRRRVMSRPVLRRVRVSRPIRQDVPVWRYGAASGMAAGMPTQHAAPLRVPPDMDAENGSMEDAALIAFLARLKKADGGYRLSANKIFETVGGDRNAVLAQVREVRSAPPSPAFRQPDGEIAPASYPVTQRRSA